MTGHTKKEVTQEIVHEFLIYDKTTGNLYWKQSPCNAVKVGSLAGNIHWSGYRRISLHGRMYQAHRLVWLYVYGKFPDVILDHKNGVRDDNRIENLRECNSVENARNSGKSVNNTSGYVGVSWDKEKEKWKAYYTAENLLITHIGYFDTPKDAHDAREKVVVSCYGEFYREQCNEEVL